MDLPGARGEEAPASSSLAGRRIGKLYRASRRGHEVQTADRGYRTWRMRWTVEADTARDVVRWPEEVDDFRTALRSDFHAHSPNCSVDVVAGSLSARFQVSAERQEDAESVARRVMADALARAGLPAPDEPLAYVGVTPTGSGGSHAVRSVGSRTV